MVGFDPFPELAGSKIPRTEEKIEAMIEAIPDWAISEAVIDPYLEGCLEDGTEYEASTRPAGRDETRTRVDRCAVVRFWALRAGEVRGAVVPRPAEWRAGRDGVATRRRPRGK